MSDGRVTLSIPDTPPSWNAYDRKHWAAKQREKDQWEMRLRLELLKWRLPKDCDRIEFEVAFQFPDRRKRDIGNYSSTLEKFLGDALQPDWLVNDDSTRFAMTRALFMEDVGSRLTLVTLDFWLSAAVAA